MNDTPTIYVVAAPVSGDPFEVNTTVYWRGKVWKPAEFRRQVYSTLVREHPGRASVHVGATASEVER